MEKGVEYFKIAAFFLIFAAAAGEVFDKQPSLHEIIEIWDITIWLAVSLSGGFIAAGQIYTRNRKLPDKVELIIIFFRSIVAGLLFGPYFQSKFDSRIYIIPIFLVSFGAEYIFEGIDKIWKQFGINPVKFIQDWISYRSFIKNNSSKIIEFKFSDKENNDEINKKDN